MSVNVQQLEKSRLGRLLVNRGLITEAQLLEALDVQQSTGTKLGMVLVSRGWISERDLDRALSRQKRYRYTAALLTMVAAPLQPMLAFGATLPTGAAPVQASQTQQLKEDFTQRLQAMSEEEMAAISGSGLEDFFEQMDKVQEVAGGVQTPDAVDTMETVAKTFVPVLNMLDADVTIEGVVYDDSKPRYAIHEDGRIEMALPTHIERIALNNLRVTGSTGPAFGDVTLNDVSFSPDSRLVVTPR